MAVVTQILNGQWVFGAAFVWDTGAVPADGDDVVLLENGNIIVDDDTNALNSITQTGDASRISIPAVDKTLNCDGNASFSGWVTGPGTLAVSGSLTTGVECLFENGLQLLLDGTGTVTNNATALGGADTVINTAGTITLATDFPTIDFTRTLGAVVTDAVAIIASGNVLHSGGTGNPLITMTGDKTFTWASNTDPPARLTVADGATVTRTGATSYVRSLVVEEGGELVGDSSIVISLNGDFAPSSCAGAITGGILYISPITAHRSNTGDFTGLTCDVNINGTTDAVNFTQNGRFETTGNLIVANANNDRWVGFVVNGLLRCGDVTLGGSGNRSGVLSLGSGSHHLASVIMGDDANTANGLLLGSSSVFLSGTADGNSPDTNPMTITANGANLHGGTLLDANVVGPLHAWGVTIAGATTKDVLHEGSNAGAALGGLHSMIGVAA